MLMSFIFIVGYVAITLESKIKVNKAAIALLLAVFCWGINFSGSFPDERALHNLVEHLGEISQVIIFLLGAMTIVELIDAHNGFKIITSLIRTNDKTKLFWIVSIITFFLSALLDNLTTSIIMVVLVRRLIQERNERLIFVSIVIIAANAGGAWSPMGDITTTMLWIGDRVTTGKMIKFLLIPSLISMLVPLICLSRNITKGMTTVSEHPKNDIKIRGAKRVLYFGITTLICVPILKAFLGIPPYMGIMLGLGVMWVLTDLMNKEEWNLSVPHVLTKIDISSILFFLGILLTVAAVETAGILDKIALWMDTYLIITDVIVVTMGLMSSVIDNVPLTAAAMSMYDLSLYPVDSKFWEMMVYCVGTGGSILIIGSAAGVVVMGMEKISFTWYLKKISFPAFVGYLAGVVSFLVLYKFIS